MIQAAGPRPATDALDTNDVIALATSTLFPGVGHMMLGQPMKGVAILIVGPLTCYGGGLLWLLGLIDIYCLAVARKKRQIGDWETFPK
jgi:TM2 domain-containing membrane protein YozV